MNDTSIDLTGACLTYAHERRFALALQVGRMTGAIKLALGDLDAAARYPAAAEALMANAASVLRMALEAESERG